MNNEIGKIQRIKDLNTILKNASNAYYNTDKIIMEDQKFDKLFDELKQLEQETNFILSDSVTQNVGFEVKSKLEKVQHSIPLKSLGKTKSIDEVKKFINNKEALIMLKGDGLTCELIYNNGELIQGSTRGNSIVGEDITHNVKTFKNIPLRINFKGYLKLAGESVIFDKDFEAINSKLSEEDKYSNSRNLVAGSVRQLDSKICDARNVNFMAFSLLECKDENGDEIEFKTIGKQFNFLLNQGFYVIPNLYFIPNIDDLNDNIESLKQYAKDNGIPIDGEVIKYSDIVYGKSLGETEHHPLSAIALKFVDNEYETKYIRTEWQVSRTSIINPVGVFQPIDMDGAITERATLHNIDYFEALQLGKDDIIVTARQNQVIPKILDNKTKSNTETIPAICPICGAKTEIRTQKTARFLYCTNDNCPSKKIAEFEHFVSRDAMNIIGLSEATIEKFINKGFLKTLSDIFKLDEYKNEITHMDGFGLKSYNNLMAAIGQSKQCKLSNFIYALGIPNTGKGTSKDLCTFVNGDINKLMNITYGELLQMKDCGEVTARSIVNYFNDYQNIYLLEELLDYITIEEDIKTNTTEIKDNPFKNKKVYCTGTFLNYKKDDLKSILVNLGAEYASGYAKSLDYLVVGAAKTSTKEDKARKDGVPILTEEQFNQMIGRN